MAMATWALHNVLIRVPLARIIILSAISPDRRCRSSVEG